MFILSLILLIAALVVFFVMRSYNKDVHRIEDLLANTPESDNYRRKELKNEGHSSALAVFITLIVAGVLALGFAITLFFSMFYTQDVGEAKVLKDWTGNIVGKDVTAGPDFKAPWVDTIDYDIRNQLAAFIGNGRDSYNGQTPNGPQITIQDKDGVTSNMDLTVVYSIKPGSVIETYNDYPTQADFVTRLIEQDIRSISRDVPAKFTTLELLTDRAEVRKDIQEALEKSWEKRGVIVESVAVQEIRPPKSVKESFANAQSARIEVEKAAAELEKAKVDAQQKVAQATAEAEANSILNASLTDTVLKQRYLDTLGKLAAEGNVVIVPEGFNGLVNVK